jgi:tRNA (guanine37-N1)-methyltransferase
MAPLRFDLVTIFPALVEASLAAGIPRIAAAKGLATYHPVDLREFTTDRHRSVDDRPYGGGPGMVMRPEPMFQAVDSLELEPEASLILLSPQGVVFDQALARELSRRPRIALVCGRYEGFDERIRTGLQPLEVSLGDYVLSGGELAACVIVDCVVRLLPGVLGDECSPCCESFGEDGLLDFPQYTRPPTFRGLAVPDVLRSGDHQAIEQWRRSQARLRTCDRRPDLLPGPGDDSFPGADHGQDQ